MADKDVSPLEALEIAQGGKQEAARMLKISRSKLWRKMRLYHISDKDFKK